MTDFLAACPFQPGYVLTGLFSQDGKACGAINPLKGTAHQTSLGTTPNH